MLKDFALVNRATVFESNGLDFAGHYKLNETIPPGFRATWRERAKVVIAKLYRRLSKGIPFQQIDDLLPRAFFVSISDLRFDDIKMIISAIDMVALILGALAIVNRNK